MAVDGDPYRWHHSITSNIGDYIMVARALKYLNLGYSVIPVSITTKRPTVPWVMYQHRYPTKHQILKWFNGRKKNMAVICGDISGNLIVIDFDSAEYYHRHRAHLAGLPVVRTRKGYHVYMRTDIRTGLRNTKIAMKGNEVLAEIRANGGYVLSEGSFYGTGFYEFVEGGIEDVPYLDKEETDYILGQITTKELKPKRNYEVGEGGQQIVRVASRSQYIARMMEYAVEQVRSAANGDRNNALFKSAALMANFAAGGYLDIEDIVSTLESAASNAGLDTEEIDKTIESAVITGFKSPITIEQDSILEELGV